MKAQQGFRRFRIRGGDKQVKKYIEDLREQIVRAVKPQQIILFGSYAYGTLKEDSDVDLLVVMPFEGHPAYQATKIRMQIKPQVPLDLLVRRACVNSLTSILLANSVQYAEKYLKARLHEDCSVQLRRVNGSQFIALGIDRSDHRRVL